MFENINTNQSNRYQNMQRIREQDLRDDPQKQEQYEHVLNTPLTPEKHIETPMERNVRLLTGVQENLHTLKEQAQNIPDHLRGHTDTEDQIAQLESLQEKILSNISPSDLEEYLKNKE